MQDTIPIEIREYNESLAEDIAQMWNTWDDLWPGGFTQGIPYTAERVKKQYGQINALALLIAIDKQTNKPVGSCTLHPNWRDNEAAYIGTLGVSPEVLNKKIGKQLLLESIRISSEKGYTRVDLNTWAGNMRAVPLYKKVGMMWDPDGQGLTMFDYIPGILTHPLCTPFFDLLDGEYDWYDTYIRNPTQSPDIYSKDGMSIYPYEFKYDNASLSVTVDKYARGITAIQRMMSNQTISIAASVSSHEVLCGLPYSYSLKIVNNNNQEMKLTVRLKGFRGLEFDDNSTKKFVIKPNSTEVWDVPFHLTSSAPLFRDNIKTESIITEMNLDGKTSLLYTGMKIRSPAEIRTRWGECRISPSGSVRIPITIISNLDQKSVAQVNLQEIPSHMQIQAASAIIQLGAHEQGGTVLEVSSSDELVEGTYDLWLNLVIQTDDNRIVETRKFRIPIFCLGKKDVAMGEDDRRREIVIVSPHYTARIAKEGAILVIQDVYSQISPSLTQVSEIGPPFGINPFRFAERKVQTSVIDTGLVVSMKAKHPDRPLVVEDRAIFEFGTGVIKHEQWVENVGVESHSFQSRLVGRGGGVNFASGKVYIPFLEGVLSEPLGNFRFCYPSIPTSPSAYSEGWVAIENEDATIGQMWDPKEADEIRIFSGQLSALGFPMKNLEPGEVHKITNSWLVFNARSWQDVRRLWRSRVAHYYEDVFSPASSQLVERMLAVKSQPIVLPHVSEAYGALRLHNPLHIAHEGMLELTPPNGWNAELKINSKKLNGLQTEINFAADTSIDVSLKPSSKIMDRFAIYKGQLNLKMEYDTNESLTVAVLGSSKHRIDVTEGVEQGCKVHRVKNGLLEFAVSEDYGGCMFSLRNEKGVEFLTSSFPKASPRPGAFFDNYHGGVQPLIFDDDFGESLAKALTNKEKMSAKPYQRGHWSGVEVSWKGEIQQTARGIDSYLRYITTAGSPLVVIEWQIVNNTTAPVRFWPSFIIDPKLDAELAESKFQTKWSGKEFTIRQGNLPMAVSPSNSIVWLMPEKNSRKTRGFSFIAAGDEGGMLDAYLGNLMIMALVDGRSAIMPGQERLLTACLFVDPPNWEELDDIKHIIDSLYQ
ncbi:MAG: GNAT family N-acetyltransferase [Candidatus Thorarchaeota archaeon]